MAFLAQAVAIAADAGRGSQDPGAGTSLLLILAVVVAVVVGAALLFTIVHRLTRASRGGVRDAPGEYRQGNPPLESIGRRRS